MQEDALFCGSFSAQPSLAKRLADEFKEATREFREDPKHYITSAIKVDGAGNHRRKSLLKFGLAIAIVIYAIFFAAVLALWAYNARHAEVAKKNPEITVLNMPYYKMQDDTLRRSEKEEGGGGGGGGRNEPTPASQGAPSPFSLVAPIIAPTTRETLKPPALPVAEILFGDPALNVRRDQSIPTGLPDGVPGPPSDGPGNNGGIGTGDKGGIGPGEGPGFGPGKDGGEGGGPYGGPGGRPGSDAATIVDTRPVPLNEPRPNYTEEARQHKVTGIVRARVLIGVDGLIKQVRITRGLPDGLNEEAIRAAMQMRFKPAIKNGQAVSYWTSLDVEFNLR